ncbi:MAG: hypothetical protein H6930_00790 [Rhodoferax sp.]|nr:hypothetical protein [Rhodoferax sp.]
MAHRHRSWMGALRVSAVLLAAWVGAAVAQQPPVPAAASSAPTVGPTMLIVSCDPGGCWDEFGVRYDRAGGGVFIRPDGHECTAVRGRMACR